MRAILLLLTLLLGLAAPAQAADDAAAAQAVIRGQEQAIGRDDAAGAYAFAAPAIQSMFPDPDIFLSMVRKGYPPVYRHRTFEFGTSRNVDGVMVQEVQIVDAEGVAWTALYTLQSQPDGSLRISGCVLTKLASA